MADAASIVHLGPPQMAVGHHETGGHLSLYNVNFENYRVALAVYVWLTF